MKTTILPMRRVLGMLALLGVLGTAAESVAQTAPWNRRVEAVSVTPSATSPGLYDVHAVIGIHRDGNSTGTTMEDLSLQVELNPTAGDPHYGWIELTVEYDPATDPGGCVDASACGGGCGEGYVDGVTEGLLCLPDGACSPICDCKCKFPPITATFPDKALQPGDALSVVLTPLVRTEPDSDPTDNQMGYMFTGDPVLWDR
ncbi:MAG TPA: hypothetical protein VKU85_04670, partial [bacterium]|nr:hypothetical protein [bacterium]